jgi:hypothetical protein
MCRQKKKEEKEEKEFIGRKEKSKEVIYKIINILNLYMII